MCHQMSQVATTRYMNRPGIDVLDCSHAMGRDTSGVTTCHPFGRVHPPNSTWNLEMMVSNKNLFFQGSIFRFHVCFGGCIRYQTMEIYGNFEGLALTIVHGSGWKYNDPHSSFFFPRNFVDTLDEAKSN